MSAMHPDDSFTKVPDIAEAPDYEIPRSKIKDPQTGEYAERIIFSQGFRTDGSGNFAGSIYDLRQGFRFTPIRLTVVDPSGTYTPASPYANALAWMGIFTDDTGPAVMSDFAPNTAGGPIIPGMFVYPTDGGPLCRQFLGFRIVSGPASIPLVVNGIGILREA